MARVVTDSVGERRFLTLLGRLAQSGTAVPTISSAFYSGSGLESRVRRLVQRADSPESVTGSIASSIMGASAAVILAMLAAASLVYEGTEARIKHLP